MDEATLAQVRRLHAIAPIKVLTLAPEIGQHTALIPELTALGIRVQLGHSAGSYEDGVAALAIPADVTASRTGVTVALAAEAYDDNVGRLSVLGSLGAPERIRIAAGMPAAPFYRRWWFWAGIGAIAIGTGVAIEQLRSVGPQQVSF